MTNDRPADRQHQIRSLFVAALKLEPAELDAWLEGQCEGDDELRQELIAILKHHREGTDELLDRGLGRVQ